LLLSLDVTSPGKPRGTLAAQVAIAAIEIKL
jgi:hypothetical protein